jgi:hypothetical protein
VAERPEKDHGENPIATLTEPTPLNGARSATRRFHIDLDRVHRLEHRHYAMFDTRSAWSTTSLNSDPMAVSRCRAMQQASSMRLEV